MKKNKQSKSKNVNNKEEMWMYHDDTNFFEIMEIDNFDEIYKLTPEQEQELQKKLDATWAEIGL